MAFVGLSLDGTSYEKTEALGRTGSIVEREGLPYRTLVWSGELDPLSEKLKVLATPYNELLAADGKILGEFEIPEGKDAGEKKVKEELLAALKKLGADPAAKTEDKK